MINIAELLKDVPKGTELWCTLFGKVTLESVNTTEFYPIAIKIDNYVEKLDAYGRLYRDFEEAESVLFPNEKCHTWEGWKPSKPHYDISNFYVGMPVLVRWYDTGKWRYSLYSFYEEGTISPFDTVRGSFNQCIPFNEYTKHLLGTTDMPSEEYINWKT